MKLSVAGMIVCFMFALSSCTPVHQEKEDKRVLGFDPHHIRLSDGTQVGIFAYKVFAGEGRRQSGEVILHMWAKNTEYFAIEVPIWKEQLTSVDYVPGRKCYDALIKEKGDRLFIFCRWNGLHFTIDKRTGRTLKAGDADDAPKECADATALKLQFDIRSVDGIRDPSLDDRANDD